MLSMVPSEVLKTVIAALLHSHHSIKRNFPRRRIKFCHLHINKLMQICPNFQLDYLVLEFTACGYGEL